MQREHFVLWILLPQYSDVIEREGCFVAWYNDDAL